MSIGEELLEERRRRRRAGDPRLSAAGVAHGSKLWFGLEADVGRVVAT